MATEVWWSNPFNYVRELAEVGTTNIAWDRGTLHKKNIDPGRFSDLYFRQFPNWRSLLIGDQGTAEVNTTHREWRNSPILYPTWEHALNPISELEDWMSTNVDDSQEHRVVVTRPPDLRSTVGKRFFIHLQELQEDNPETIMHIHGIAQRAFRYLYGRGIRSVDVQPRIFAQNGYVIMGNGQTIHGVLAPFYFPKWDQVSNMRNSDLNEPRNRCMFNIRSNLWAAANWDSDTDWSKDGYERPELPDDFWEGRVHRRRVKVVANSKPGDMVECNICSLQSRCKLYREGSLCTVPTSDGARIAKHFKTNDPEEALDGMGKIMEISAERTARALGLEDEGEIDPEVSKLVDGLWKKGLEYTKLLQPKTPLVNINNVGQAIGAAAATLTGTQDHHQLVAQAVAKLEAAGWPRAEITEDQVRAVMEEQSVPAYIQLPAAVDDANVVD